MRERHLEVSVPATIIRSDWRGVARRHRAEAVEVGARAAVCIISMAQQARPNVIHISEPVRAH